MNDPKNMNIEPLKIVLLAIGGDGGSVLTNWIVNMAESQGYWAQSTSIAGVAQRTGTTVYYIEIIPLKDITINGIIQTPVLAQMPAPFDVDIVMTTELLEVGRALHRKFVSKKTTLIFSTHRNLAIREKEKPGDGISESKEVFELAQKYSKKCLYGNLKLISDKNKSVISASLFGALAASGSTPFQKQDFLNTIVQDGVAVKQSTANFEESYAYIEGVKNKPQILKPTLAPASLLEISELRTSKKLSQIIQIIRSDLPKVLHNIIYTGVINLSDWQNEKWAKKYLEKLSPFIKIDTKRSPQKYELSNYIARYLAIGMTYDDMIFVADQKTRTERYKEMYNQIEAKESDLVSTSDYLHPSFEEVTGFMPKKIGAWAEKNKKLKLFFKKYLDRDRRMYSTNLFSFLLLYILGGMKKWRLKTLRHHHEMKNVDQWLNRINETVDINYHLAIQITKTYRLKKGYGDTYKRGDSKFWAINNFAMQYKDKEQVSEYTEHLIAIALETHDTKTLNKKIKELETLLN